MSQTWFQKGNTIDVPHTNLVFLDTGDGFVNSGQPVVIGNANLPGVAELDAKASGDIIPCTITQVHKLPVVGKGVADASTPVVYGDLVYWDTATEVLNVDSGEIQYGIALGAVAGDATTEIPVLLLKP
jgi:hypothetical protein